LLKLIRVKGRLDPFSVQNKLIERMDSNLDIFTKIMDDKTFGNVVKEWMLYKVYHRLNEILPGVKDNQVHTILHT